MRSASRAIVRLAFLATALSAPGCGREPREAGVPPASGSGNRQVIRPQVAIVADSIPADQVEAVMSAHLQGLGHMERYEYDKAAEAFREVHERAPGWIAGSVNLAIALLNQTGDEAETNRARGGSGGGGDAEAPRRTRFDEALDLLGGVLEREPENLHAHYCRGVILEYLGRLAEAHRDFVFVTERDPSDAHAWYKVGSTLTDPDDPNRPAGPKQAARLIEIYAKAIECNPYLVSALYRLQTAYAWAGQRQKQKELIQLWQQLNPKNNAAGPGDTAETFYGEMGRYAMVVNPIDAPREAAEPGIPPRFDLPSALAVELPSGHRWVEASDFQGPLAVLGRARTRFGAAVASFDADGDGRADLFLAAAVKGPHGVRDLLLVNKGDGKFEDATARFGLPDDAASLGIAAADFDADRKVDLFLTGVGRNRLYRNTGQRFEDVSSAVKPEAPAISMSARWLDLDQDGDLDLYVVNYASVDHVATAFTARVPPGIPNDAFRNDGKPSPVAGRPPDNWAPLAVAPDDLPAKGGLSVAFSHWPDPHPLTGDDEAHTAIAALDVDDDRDIDLVLASDGEPPRVVMNDRLGRFHETELLELAPHDPIFGMLVTDLDKDGHTDLVAVGASGRVAPWRNTMGSKASSRPHAWEPWPADAREWRAAAAVDLDLDTWPDLVGLTTGTQSPSLLWARNDGRRLTAMSLALGPDPEGAIPLAGFALADVVGDPLPDLVLVRPGKAPRLARNLGNGQHWLALDLSGRWKVQPDHMRTNPHGLGTRVALEGQGLSTLYDHTTPEAGLAQSCGPIVLGMGKLPSAALLRLRWPDGTMQCELNVAADKLLPLAEHNRKTGSCPVLFTWDGTRFVCVGDFLGGGGLGYLVAPGQYGEPDRDEAVAIAPGQLRAEQGAYRLVVTEPMDEVAYLDRLTLDVVDRPPGVSAAPDERFAPEGPRPSGELIAWRSAIDPVRATDLAGKDVSESLHAWDRRTVDGFARLRGWVGYAEEHGIVLDFGEKLSRFGPADSLVLCLAGWVEYPYSQTNYAAATAGVVLKPPALERQRADGTWETIVAQAGYPAGLPRLTTLDLTGKLTGPKCVLRLRTNMECYWDQAFIAVRERDLPVRVTSLEVSRAELGDRGYTRESSPDGRLPLLYDYDHVEPAPLARMAGRLTRYGDVKALLQADDDHFCLIGPGDEVRLEFPGNGVPPLPEGWTRSYVLRAAGYCKDADPFTAASDSVGPLPWRGMPAYPFGPEGERRQDVDFLKYLRDYQTRPAGAP